MNPFLEVLPIAVAGIGLILGALVGRRAADHPLVRRLSPVWFAVVVAFFLLGGKVSAWVAGAITMLGVSALISYVITLSLLAFVAGFALRQAFGPSKKPTNTTK